MVTSDGFNDGSMPASGCNSGRGKLRDSLLQLDCGIYPGMSGVDALPFVDFVDCEELDLLLVRHFHLDHCGAVPWLLERTEFRGRCFTTRATKTIYRMLIGDYLKDSGDRLSRAKGSGRYQVSAGHVLGACMLMIEIAGVRVLYTDDFSRFEDRHLCAAELPTVSPDVLICESTYGTQVHEGREEREKR
uniref:Lactamase_B domain-containing protein n=1 Tax=Ascaris lumbricoides TaxID=6252 RepID=A0A0M3I0M7_ASCLU